MKDDQENNVIVVTWDFTHVSEYALAHAVKIANVRNYEIQLLYIAKPGSHSKKIENARTKMLQVCAETSKLNGIICKAVVKEGNLYSTISDYATQTSTELVVMGTHGRKGIQKLFGSKTLRVLVGSNSPFIVVKSKPVDSLKMSNVVFPIDFKSENKEKLRWAIYFGQNFQSKIHLFKYPFSDRRVDANLDFAISFLKQYDVEYEIHTAPPRDDFSNEMIYFAEKIKADLIIVTTTKNVAFFDCLFGADEQHIIDNAANIPVMCVNPQASDIIHG